ncbi:hypothetical protein LSAT2_026861 [Lamellibrachia satsuma]|nr:hypothetical protein LSAT2_026861 [Lamellibrachia satsuma]
MVLDVLNVLCQLSVVFQRDKTTVNDAVEALSTANLSLVALTLRPGENMQSYVDHMDQHENRFHEHEMTNVQQKWPEQQRHKINKLVDYVMSHMNSRLESTPTRPELADLRLLTTPTKWPEEPAAICGEEEVRLVCEHFRPVLGRVQCDTDAVQRL